MSRKRYRRKGLTEEEKIGWTLAFIVFIFYFTVHFVGGVFRHCIFEWPIRTDFKICWNEQIDPAKEKAAEKAAPLIP